MHKRLIANVVDITKGKMIQKQLDIYDPMVKRLKRALKITDERLSKIGLK